MELLNEQMGVLQLFHGINFPVPYFNLINGMIRGFMIT